MSGTLRQDRYGLSAAPPASASVTDVDSVILAANDIRFTVTIINLSATYKVSLGFGQAAVINKGVTLYPGDAFWMADEDRIESEVHAVTEAGQTVSVSIQELSVR